MEYDNTTSTSDERLTALDKEKRNDSPNGYQEQVSYRILRRDIRPFSGVGEFGILTYQVLDTPESLRLLDLRLHITDPTGSDDVWGLCRYLLRRLSSEFVDYYDRRYPSSGTFDRDNGTFK